MSSQADRSPKPDLPFSKMAAQQFFLKKWYLDGVSDDGRTLIAYAATLRWRGFKIGYVSTLYLRAPGESRSESRLKEAPEPVVEDAVIRWQEEALGLSGRWERAAPPLRAMLHQSEEGYLDWHCLQPAARCHIQLGHEPPLQGWGYVECLEMTIPPWKLGLQELRWGRFAHPDAPLVWIDWKGAVNRCWVFDRQGQVQSATVSDEWVHLTEQQGQLSLYDPAVIEDKNKFMETVDLLVRWMPGIDRFTPLRFLKGRETKWRSAATMTVPGRPDRTGWAIHELVKF